jgi:tetratricopeptide (TPR) repeat protein
VSSHLAEAKFVRADVLSAGDRVLSFTHEYGEVVLPWTTITHAFLVSLEKEVSGPAPLLIVISEISDCFNCIDENTRTLEAPDDLPAPDEPPAPDGSTPETNEQAQPPEEEKPGKTDFTHVVQQVSSHFIRVSVDEPLAAYLHDQEAPLPAFATLTDVARYCIDKADRMAAHRGDRDDRGTRIELSKGMLIDGKFTILEVLSSPAETIYKVLDPDHSEFFTIKTLAEKYRNDKGMKNLFIGQARLWVKIEPHPNLVKAELLKIIEGLPYVFIEFVEGSDLDKLTKREFLSVKSIIEVAIQLCAGLEHAFRQSGAPHRNLTPRNCVIAPDGILKITGYGMARILDGLPYTGPIKEKCQKIENGELAVRDFPLSESLLYMAPELFSDLDAAGMKSDIYSFGVIIYRLLTGYNPFSGESPSQILSNHFSLAPVNPQRQRAGVPPPLAQLVLKCLEKAPGLRYEGFSPIRLELERIYQGLTGSAFDRPEIEKELGEDYWINKGLAQRSMNNNQEGMEALDEALRINPRSLRAKFHRGYSWPRPGGAGTQPEPENWELWFWKAESLRQAGEFDEAIKCYDKALLLNNREAFVWAQKARALAENRRYKEALRFYERALALNPRAAEHWDSRGYLLIRLKSHRAALASFNEALECSPSFKWALYHQGIAFSRLGYFKEALDALQKTLALDPGFCDAWMQIGDCYRDLGRRAEAAGAYRSALELSDGNIDAFLACIQILKEDSRWEEALEMAKRALEIAPSDVTLALDHAEILFRLSHYEESRALCERILKEDPAHEDAQLLLKSLSAFVLAQEELFRELLSPPPVPEESYSKDINGLITMFCSFRDALDHLEISTIDRGLKDYLKGSFWYLEGNVDAALEHCTKALEDPQVRDRAQRLKERIDLQLEKQGLAPARKKDLFQFAKNLVKKGSDSLDELLINAFEKVKNKEYQEARTCLRDILTKNPAASSCVYLFARTYELEQNNEKAQHYYGEFCRQFPLSIGACGDKLFSRRDSKPDEAEKLHRTLIGSYRRDFSVWVEYMRFLSRKGHDERLRLLVSGLLKESFKEWDHLKDIASYWNVRGILQIYLCRYKEARESFSRALELENENPTSLFGMGKFFDGSGLCEEAIEHFRSLLPREEMFGMASYLISDIFLRQKQEMKALGTLDEALLKFPSSPPLLHKKAQVYAQLKMFHEMDELYARITTLNDAFAPIKVLRSYAFMEELKPDDAKADMLAALSLDKSNVHVERNLGCIHLETGNLEKALAVLNTIINYYPLNFETFMGCGIIHYLQKDYERARISFQKALELNPHEPRLWLYMGAVHYHLKNSRESEICWENAFNYRGGWLEAWINKGAFLFHREDYAASRESADLVLAMEPQNQAALLIKAKCEWILGNPQLAAEIFVKATEIDAASAELWFNRGLCGLSMRNFNDAQESLERAMKLDPSFADASIAFCALWVLKNGAGEDTPLFQKVENKFPREFRAWKEDYAQSGNLLHYLKPMDSHGEPFTLPFKCSLSLTEPIVLFDLLTRQSFL